MTKPRFSNGTKEAAIHIEGFNAASTFIVADSIEAALDFLNSQAPNFAPKFASDYERGRIGEWVAA